MSRFTHNLIVAVLTFTVGGVVGTLSLSMLPRFAHFVGSLGRTEQRADLKRDGACDEWEKRSSLSHGLGWDLTYMPLLQNAGVCPGELYCEIVGQKSQPPVHKLFAEWQGDPIVSSILIELPDGHADMAASWLIRTTKQAYWWKYHPHDSNPIGMQPLPAQHYDSAFETIRCWQQHDPLNRTFHGSGDGYIGFLSLYKQGKSRQMLVTSKDLFLEWPAGSGIPDEATLGRLWKTLKPIHLAIREQQKQAEKVSK